VGEPLQLTAADLVKLVKCWFWQHVRKLETSVRSSPTREILQIEAGVLNVACLLIGNNKNPTALNLPKKLDSFFVAIGEN